MKPLSPTASVAIVTHVRGTGPADALEQYAVARAGRVYFVGHPFADARAFASFMRDWRAGELVRTRRFPWSSRIPSVLTWCKDLLLSLVWLGRTRGRIDVFVGADGLNTLAGLVLRRCGKVRRVVFWTIDYVPDRFASPLLNWIYHRIDRICVEAADETWNLSPRMTEARHANGIFGVQRTVPMGAWSLDDEPAYDPSRIVFVGHLLEKQGLQVVLRALPLIRRSRPDVSLLVIGDGPYRETLVRLAASTGVADSVDFRGYVEDHREVEELIACSAVGVALYDPAMASFTAFADPGKIRAYLAAGVPVVATDVPESAEAARDAGAALVVPYDVDAVAGALTDLLGDEERRTSFRTAARRMGREHDWRTIFDAAFGAG